MKGDSLFEGFDVRKFYDVSFRSAIDVIQNAHAEGRIIVLAPHYSLNLRKRLEEKFFHADSPKVVQNAFVEEMKALEHGIRSTDLMRLPEFYNLLIGKVSREMNLSSNETNVVRDDLYRPIHWGLFIPREDGYSSILHGLSRVFLSRELQGNEAELLTHDACKNYLSMTQSRLQKYTSKLQNVKDLSNPNPVLCA